MLKGEWMWADEMTDRKTSFILVLSAVPHKKFASVQLFGKCEEGRKRLSSKK